MLDAMEFAQCTPSLSQALRIKKMSADGNLTVRDMEDILSEIKQKEIDRVVFKTEQLHRFFPVSYTAEQMRRDYHGTGTFLMGRNGDYGVRST